MTTLGTLKGSNYRRLDGTVGGGSVLITTNIAGGDLRDPVGDVIWSGSLEVPIVDGTWTVQVPPTDDPTLSAQGFVYVITERLTHKERTKWRTTSTSLPAGSVVDMADLPSGVVIPPSPPETGVARSEFLAFQAGLPDTFARVVDGVLVGPDDQPIEVGTSDILLSDTRPASPAVGLVRIGLAVEPEEPEPEPGSVILSDNYDRADAGSVGAPQVGTTPIEEVMWIRSNAMQFATAGGKITYPIAPANYTAEFQIVESATPGSVLGGVSWRYTDENTRYSLQGGTGTVERRASGYTNLGTIAGGALVAGDVIKIKTFGSVHTIYRNGAQVYTFTDAALTDGDLYFAGNSNGPRIAYVAVTTP